VLQELALRIKDCLRSTDSLARMGGEEFVVVLPSTELKQAQEVAERIRVAIASKPFALEASSIRVTISVGVAAGTLSHLLLSAADQALYRAKDLGRDRVETVPPH
jgi:diguanylate cyclase (GGDEF)-like protein